MLRTSLSSSKPKLPKWAELPSNSDNRSKILTGFMIEKGQASDEDRTRDTNLEGWDVTATPHSQGDSGRTRTYDRLLRRQLLYPTELLSQDKYFTRFVLDCQDVYR